MFSASLRLIRPFPSKSAMIEFVLVWALTVIVQRRRAESVVIVVFSELYIAITFLALECSKSLLLCSPLETISTR